jgi:FixJ family two-component response regulator
LREGNGLSAVDEILRTAFIPHLFISGDIKKVLARRPGAVTIEKPFRDSELDQAIRRALDAADIEGQTAKLAK